MSPSLSPLANICDKTIAELSQLAAERSCRPRIQCSSCAADDDLHAIYDRGTALHCLSWLLSFQAEFVPRALAAYLVFFPPIPRLLYTLAGPTAMLGIALPASLCILIRGCVLELGRGLSWLKYLHE